MQLELTRFRVDSLPLVSGGQLRDAVQAFAVIGTLNAARDNAIILPTRVAGSIADNLHMIGPGRPLDPARWCIIVPALLGNGESSSPSNTPDFPTVTIADAVRLQHRLLVDGLGITRLHAAIGWSMGGQQAYQWAGLYPDLVPRLAVICGAAATSDYPKLFLDSLTAALALDGAAPPVAGLKALGRVWAPWAFSETWYRRAGYRSLGFDSLDAFVAGFWESVPLGWNADDLRCQLGMWRRHDIGLAANGDRQAALRSIQARTLLLPATSDAYFPVADNSEELRHLADARLAPIDTDWGHMAGAGLDPDCIAVVDRGLAELLQA